MHTKPMGMESATGVVIRYVHPQLGWETAEVDAELDKARANETY